MPPPRPPALLLDALAAAALGLLGVLSLATGAPGARAGDPLGLSLVVLGAAAVVLRQRYPLAVLAVTAATSLAVLQLDYHQSAGGLTVLWALHAVAARLPARTAVVAVGATLALVHLVLTTAPDPTAFADRVSTSVILLAGWGLGLAGRGRRERYDALQARAAAERSAALAEQRATLAEERALIAREMQDLVAHDLAEVAVQVAAARRAVGRDPVAAEGLLAGAEGVARTAATEVRRILQLLTDPGSGWEAGPDPGLRPLPGLDDLPTLTADARADGIRVRLEPLPATGAVAAGPALLGYRLVEAALGSACRRGVAAASVAVSRPGGGLRVEVRDDSPGVAADPAGSLGSLRRRAELYGGRVARTDVPAVGQDREGAHAWVLEIPAATSRSGE